MASDKFALKHVACRLEEMGSTRNPNPTIISSEVLIQFARSLLMAHQLRLVAITQLETVKTHRVMPARVQHGV